MSRFVSIFFVIVLVLALAVPAFALDLNGSDGYSLPDCVCQDWPVRILYKIGGHVYYYAVGEECNIYLAEKMESSMDGFSYHSYFYPVPLSGNSTFSFCHHELFSDGTSSALTSNKLVSSNEAHSMFSRSSSVPGIRTDWWAGYIVYNTVSVDTAKDVTPFPLPPVPPKLSLTVQELGAEKLNQLFPEVAGTMKILALCGVGLIASLVALSLFGKVFHRYRK